MDFTKIMKILIFVVLSLLMSFQFSCGTPIDSPIQKQDSDSNSKPIQREPKFRVLEEPNPESFNHNFKQFDTYENHGPVEPDLVIGSKLLNGNGNGYTLESQIPKINSGSEPRYSIQRNRGKRPKKPNSDDPSRRQDVTTEAPKLDITSVSPIQSSLGGLTGLQGLPPLSLIQFVKLLVAVTPFIIPLVFVPLLIFTLGMFMIPVNKTSYFIGADDKLRNDGSSTWTAWGYSIIPPLTNFAKKVANHEECIERLTCEIGRKYLPVEDGKSSLMNRDVLQRFLNYFNHPLTHRISHSLKTSPDACNTRTCGAASFLEKNLFRRRSDIANKDED